MNPCSICLNELDVNKNFVSLECGHKFCLSCILSYIEKTDSEKSCPLCRNKDKIFKLDNNEKELEKVIKKLNKTHNSFRESLLALTTINESDINDKDKVNISKNIINKYHDVMWDNVMGSSDDESSDDDEIDISNTRVIE